VGDSLTPTERSLAQRLIDSVDEFNLEVTGIRDFRELLTVETDGDGELVGGVYGWSWGATCWVEVLWVRGHSELVLRKAVDR